MKRIWKILAAAAAAAALTPYRVQRDEETGALDIRALLWGVKAAPRAGEEKGYDVTVDLGLPDLAPVSVEIGESAPSAAGGSAGARTGADGVPADGAPADGVPADGAPADGAPADGVPADGASADGASADGAPADGVPADGAPADGVPADDTPAGEAAMFDDSVILPGDPPAAGPNESAESNEI